MSRYFKIIISTVERLSWSYREITFSMFTIFDRPRLGWSLIDQSDLDLMQNIGIIFKSVILLSVFEPYWKLSVFNRHAKVETFSYSTGYFRPFLAIYFKFWQKSINKFRARRVIKVSIIDRIILNSIISKLSSGWHVGSTSRLASQFLGRFKTPGNAAVLCDISPKAFSIKQAVTNRPSNL